MSRVLENPVVYLTVSVLFALAVLSTLVGGGSLPAFSPTVPLAELSKVSFILPSGTVLPPPDPDAKVLLAGIPFPPPNPNDPDTRLTVAGIPFPPPNPNDPDARLAVAGIPFPPPNPNDPDTRLTVAGIPFPPPNPNDPDSRLTLAGRSLLVS